MHPASSLLKANNARGTIVLLNSCPKRIGHSKLIQYLSRGFIDKGWSTLLLQSNEKHAINLEDELQQANKQTNSSIILLGHGCDTKGIINQAKSEKNLNILAYVTLSRPENIDIDAVSELNAPLLDITGSTNNTPQVINEKWLKIIERSGGKSMELPLANHVFSSQEDNLISLVANWIKRQ